MATAPVPDVSKKSGVATAGTVALDVVQHTENIYSPEWNLIDWESMQSLYSRRLWTDVSNAYND